MKTLSDMRKDLHDNHHATPPQILREAGVVEEDFVMFLASYGKAQMIFEAITGRDDPVSSFAAGFMRALSLFMEEIQIGTEVLEARKELSDDEY